MSNNENNQVETDINNETAEHAGGEYQAAQGKQKAPKKKPPLKDTEAPKKKPPLKDTEAPKKKPPLRDPNADGPRLSLVDIGGKLTHETYIDEEGSMRDLFKCPNFPSIIGETFNETRQKAYDKYLEVGHLPDPQV